MEEVRRNCVGFGGLTSDFARKPAVPARGGVEAEERQSVKFYVPWINIFNFNIDIYNFVGQYMFNSVRFWMANDKKAADWQELTKLTQGQPIVVERVRLAGRGMTIEGAFELPQLAQLSAEDQVFVMAFLRSHGSIKEMEQVFGVSYPTIKARLNRIAGGLDFVETNPAPPAPQRGEVLERLKRGEITAAEAVKELEALS